jgi:hypothetical protein
MSWKMFDTTKELDALHPLTKAFCYFCNFFGKIPSNVKRRTFEMCYTRSKKGLALEDALV